MPTEHRAVCEFGFRLTQFDINRICTAHGLNRRSYEPDDMLGMFEHQCPGEIELQGVAIDDDDYVISPGTWYGACPKFGPLNMKDANPVLPEHLARLEEFRRWAGLTLSPSWHLGIWTI